MDQLFDSSSSSSSSEEEVHVQRRKVARIENFITTVVANCTNKEFRQHFRVTRVQFELLLNKISPLLEREGGSVGRLTLPNEKQLLAVLWLLATPDSYRSVGCRFDMGKSSLFACFCRVINALNEIAPQMIKWPEAAEKEEIKQKFQELAGFPGIIGAIDGTYVQIKAPRENPEVYINRKCFHGITLQAICTSNLKFIDCFTGYPSSVSDIRIFRNSDIFQQITNGPQNYFQPEEHIIGDKAYPVLNWCIPPYIDRRNLTQRQTHFNTIHAKTRQVIERSFSLLFGRFRRLKYLDMNRIDLIPRTIIAACVIHNICLLDEDDVDIFINEGIQQVFGEEGNIEVLREEGVEEGNIKRDYLATILN